MSKSLECFQFRETGSCKFGASCRFVHPGEETQATQRKATQVCYAFRDEGSCQYGDNCRFSHELKENVEKRAPRVPQPRKAAPAPAAEGERRARAPRAPRKPRDESAPVNTSADRLECHDFKETGSCSYGTNCRFLHTGSETRGSRRKGAEVCYSLRDEGACRFGDGCRYSHDLSAAPAGGERQAKKKDECFNFRENGTCHYGDQCRYAHVSATA